MSFEDEFDGHNEVSADKMDLLCKKADEALEMKSLVTQMEEDLKNAKAVLHKLTTKDLPDMMSELQLDEFVRDGQKMKVSDFVSGSLPKEPEKREIAIKWLEDHEGGEIIKTSIGVDFGRSEHETAVKEFDRLVEIGYNAKIDSGVHASTLAAFARERIKNGEEIDTDILGLYTGKVVKITQKK